MSLNDSRIVGGCLLSILCATALQAGTFVGNPVGLQFYGPNLQTPVYQPYSGTVSDPDPAPDYMEFPHVLTEYPSGLPVWNVDVDTATITINELSYGNNLGQGYGLNPFNGMVFSFPGLNPTIASVSLNSATTLTPYNYWATGDTVYVDYQALGIINPGTTVLDVTFAPEAGTLGMLAMALLLSARRHRFRAARES